MGLNVFVSNTCFTYCKGCYSYSREEKCKSVLATEDLVRFLKYAYSQDIKKVTLCGGDPLARKDIIKLLKEIKNIGFFVSLDTLGTPLIRNVSINNETISKLDIKTFSKLVDCIGIPIDGSTNEIIKLFRPTNSDILNDQLAICSILNDNNVKICINTVAHKGNRDDAKKLAEVVRRIDGVYRWQIFQFAPLGKYGYHNREMFEISEKEFDAYKNDVLGVFKNTNTILDFKKSKDRVSHYMLIDNSGNTWIPEFEKVITNNNFDLPNQRLTIGNITNENDWDSICTYVKKKIR